VAQALSLSLGQPVVVETKPGADGQLAGAEIMRAAPDGYTILNGTASGLSYAPAVRKTPYDPIADFTPISMFFTATFFLYAHPSVPANSMSELIAHLKANPGKLSYGTATSTAILATAELMANTGTQMTHVPYKGEAVALPDLLAGRVQLMFATPAGGLQQAKDGRLRVLVTALAERSVLMPDVPTLKEVGLPELVTVPWGGFFGPAKLPKEIVDRLSREITIALKRPEVQEQMLRVGFAARGSPPQELATLVREQLEILRRAVRDGKLQSQE
jgi:tripartite-type tricarboxylate transporter receptor subunit TctC